MTTIPALIARRLRMETELPERERMLADKTTPVRAVGAEERRQRAEQHRIAALPALADRLAGIVFDEIERSGRVLVRAQLADALHAALLRSGLARDGRFPST